MQVKDMKPGKMLLDIRPATGFHPFGPVVRCAYRCTVCGAITMVSISASWYRTSKANGRLPAMKCVGATCPEDEHDSLTPMLWSEMELILEIYRRQKQVEAIRN